MSKLAKKIKEKWNLSRAKKEFSQRNEIILDDSSKRPKTGYIFNLHRLINNEYTIVSTPYRVKRIIEELNCVIITSQRELKKYADSLDVIFSAEPGWEAPFLNFDCCASLPKFLFKSDPHQKPEYYYRYFSENRFDFMVTPYLHPTLYYFPRLKKEQLVHFPWSVPEPFLENINVKKNNSNKLLTFGAYQHDSYATRRWCEQFDFVTFAHFSGVENKRLWGKSYHQWLNSYDAAVAATSLAPQWRYTVAKYFEIPASGALLFAQETDDLDLCGFEDGKNCLIFSEENFERKAMDYFDDPDAYLPLRRAGLNLIKENHTVEKRVADLKQQLQKRI